MSEKLPALFVRANVATRPDGQYVFAWFTRQHDDEHLYLPASALRALIESTRARTRCTAERCKHDGPSDECTCSVADELEQLLSEYEDGK